MTDFLRHLEHRASIALKDHTRLILLSVIKLLERSKSKEEAIEKIADFLKKY